MKDLVSVIIPTFKGNGRLIRAINSVLDQTYKNIEIIVIDDNNPDTEFRKATEEMMDQYKGNDNVIYLKHEHNKNGSAARNTGLRYCHGDYISFLDDDDFYHPERIEECINTIKNDSDGVFSDVTFISEKTVKGYMKARKCEDLFYEFMVDDGVLGTGSNLFIRRDVLDKIGLFDESLLRHQDYEFMLRFACAGLKLEPVNRILVVKDYSGTNNVPKYGKIRLIKEQLFAQFDSYIKKYPLDKQDKMYDYHYSSLISMAKRAKLDEEVLELEKLIRNKDILKTDAKTKMISFASKIDVFNILRFMMDTYQTTKFKKAQPVLYKIVKESI